jgi:hypothetical protein
MSVYSHYTTAFIGITNSMGYKVAQHHSAPIEGGQRVDLCIIRRVQACKLENHDV